MQPSSPGRRKDTMLPSSMLRDVACPIPSTFQQRPLFHQSGSMGLWRPEEKRNDEESYEDSDRRSRVRKMGVFLAGTAAAAAAYSYGEIRKRSLMDQEAPSSDNTLNLESCFKGAASSIPSPASSIFTTVQAATTFSSDSSKGKPKNPFCDEEESASADGNGDKGTHGQNLQARILRI